MNTLSHISVLKRTGAVLAVVGAIDIAVMICCIVKGVSYSSSFNVFALAAGIFLMRGSLRAASLVRWVAIFFMAGFGALTLAWPLLQPWDLTITRARLNPYWTVLKGLLMVAILIMLFWVQRNLGDAAVTTAIARSGRNVRDMRLPAALGVGIVAALVVIIPLSVRGESGQRALTMAEAQLGTGYSYHVSSLRVMSDSTGTAVSAVVTAWNRVEVRDVPVKWRE